MTRLHPSMRRLRHFAALLLAGALLGGCSQFGDRAARTAAVPGLPLDGTGYRHGVVAVSHPLAAEAGAGVLRTGGNAIDAAAAIQFVLNVVEPQSSGIGGGGFMMIYLAAENRVVIVDSRETAPAAATADMFAGMDFEQASTSGVSVGVPGTLAGIDMALARWGSRSLAATLQPAIRLAREGFAINAPLAQRSASPRAALHAETAARFRQPDGSPLPVGHRLVQPGLAHTLQLVADRGIEVFYRGEIARAIVAAQRRSLIGQTGRGRMTLADLTGYRPALRTPVEGKYRGYRIVSMPSPSSGGQTLLMMLGLLEPYPIGGPADGWGFGGRNTLHVMAEAMRLAFADRAVWMGDADYVTVPAGGLLSNCFLSTRRALIHLDRRMATPEAGDPRPCQSAGDRGAGNAALVAGDEAKGLDTTHFTVADRWGNVVSFTTTIESAWGSGITVPGYGFLLNNELTDFNLAPRADAAKGDPGSNDVAPGKRPRSSMAPTMIFHDGKLLVAYGSPGGSTIINTVLNTTLNLIDHHMEVDAAIAAPRFSVTSAGGAILCEAGLPEASLTHLATLGHLFRAGDGEPRCDADIGSVQAVVLEPGSGLQYGGADRRREGSVIGLP